VAVMATAPPVMQRATAPAVIRRERVVVKLIPMFVTKRRLISQDAMSVSVRGSLPRRVLVTLTVLATTGPSFRRILCRHPSGLTPCGCRRASFPNRSMCPD
jgi:hypothetical protein